MTVATCPLCNGAVFSGYRRDLVKCSGCGLVVDRNVWRQISNEELEKKWFDENFCPDCSFWVTMFESWGNTRTWKRISKFLNKSGTRMLEIGVGSGSLLRFMKGNGFDVSGCDLSGAICAHVQQDQKIPMHNCAVRDLPSDTLYDIVVMNHVLEHVNDPVQFLSDVRAKLTDKGIVHIAVPNVNSWEARLPGWTSYEPYHLVYFSPATLGRVVKKAGFEILKESTHESFSGWFLAFLRTLLKTPEESPEQRCKQKQKRAESWLEHAYRLGMVIFGGISFPFRFLQGRLGHGDELIILAQAVRSENDRTA